MTKKKWFGLVGFFILLAGLPAGAYLVSQRTGLFTQASPEETPKEIKITNISDNSFTVSFITPDKAVVGYVGYGETEKLGSSSSDDRDSSRQTPRFTHHITVKNLDPATKYYFKIGSGKSVYDNGGTSYVVTTAPTTNDPPAVADPAYGKIKTATGIAPLEALVYLTAAGGTPLSSYTRETGNWLITLNNARTADLSRYVQIKENSLINISVQAGKDGIASGTTDTSNRAPIPDITLGKPFAFAALTIPTPITPPAFSLTPVGQVTESKVPLEIKTPTDGGSVTSTKPTFTGTGEPGTIITVTIESPQKITAQVTVGPNGTWSYTPTENLITGNHTITIAQGGQTVGSQFSVKGTLTATPTLPVAGSAETTFIIIAAGLVIVLLGFLGAVLL
ncbi:MAG: fibronectin type III domain-containing protein [Candidatus Blackburnbacteria bacterium]|nr:fibronectin type III domain-containing protein [Candidatus Blackburnbacteria bacterium]